jgi:hypothetical protein
MATQSNSKSGKSKNAKAAAKAAPAVKASGRQDPTPEEIGLRAYEIYVSEGCQEGSDLENWLRAERELRAQQGR